MDISSRTFPCLWTGHAVDDTMQNNIDTIMRALYKITRCLTLKNTNHNQSQQAIAKHEQVKDCMAPNGFSEQYNVDE